MLLPPNLLTVAVAKDTVTSALYAVLSLWESTNRKPFILDGLTGAIEERSVKKIRS